MRLDLSRAARDDLAEIYHYSKSRWGADQAAAYLDRMQSRIDALVRGEVSGVAGHDVSPGFRRQISKSHIIWYRVQDDILRVIRVLHQSRDVGRWVA